MKQVCADDTMLLMGIECYLLQVLILERSLCLLLGIVYFSCPALDDPHNL